VIAEGACADLILVNGDPTRDVSILLIMQTKFLL